MIEEDKQHIIQLLKKLNKNYGHFSIECFENYCHIYKTNSAKVLRFETTSHQLSNVDLPLDKEIKKLGFKKGKENYSKEIILNSESDYYNIAKEIEIIFESIYKVENCEFESDDKILERSNIKTKKLSPSSKETSTIAKHHSNDWSNGKWILIVISCITIYFLFFDNDNKKQKNNTQSESPLIIDAWDNSVYQVEDFIKKNILKDPKSYQSIEWQPVMKIPNSTSMGVTHYIVIHKFRAKNSYGGYNIEQYMCELNENGEVIDVKDMIQNIDLY